MRNIILYSVLVLLIGCKDDEQAGFEVEGSIKNSAANTIYLEESSLSNLQPVLVDSAHIGKDGTFDLKTLGKEESIYSLRLDQEMYPFASFINDSRKVTVHADFKATDLYTIKGSAASEKLKEYLKMNSQKVRTIYNLNRSIDSLQKQPQSDSLVALQTSKRDNAVKDLKTFTQDFLKQSNSPALTMFVLGSYQSLASNSSFGLEGFSEPEVNDLIANAAKKFPEHKSIADLSKRIEAQAKQQEQQASQTATPGMSWLNKPAPNFTLPDVNGNPVSLNSFKGKYVLVDFWASWCAPCREENPNVVSAYKKYKDKNFTILGVSLDQKKEPWLKAIQSDGLAWTHVSDLKFWDSQVVNLYGFEGIPFNVLLNPDGVVIGEGLRGTDLDQKLASVLK